MLQLWKKLKPALILFCVMTCLCGVVYPAVVTGAAQWWFPRQANGSVINITHGDGSSTLYGSELIGQQFTKPEYLIGRPLGATNLSPTGEEQAALVAARVAWWKTLDPANAADIPMELVTASGSGVDPNLSPEAAAYQAERIATVRGIPRETVLNAIEEATTGRFLGIFGEPTVNVLRVNLKLDGLL